MITARRLASLVPALVLAVTFATTLLAPGSARADDQGRVESIAAKGTIPAVVPVEAGLGLGLAAALLALGMERRSRR